MKRPENRLDQHGFPIPAKFDQEPSTDQPPKPLPRRRRWVLLILLLLVAGALVFESPLATAGRRAIGNFYLGQAQQKYLNGDLPGALAEISSAIGYLHDEPTLYFFRGQWRLQVKDFEGSLADFSRAIEMFSQVKETAGRRSKLFVARGFVYLRIGRQREALDDMTQAVRCRAARDAEPFNARAYGRALAGVELPEALEDAEQALRFDSPDNPSYLDTRGYVHLLLGHYDLALKDLDQAIKGAEAERQQFEQFHAQPGRDKRFHALDLKHHNETLAVLYHHRGQIHEKLGHSEQAKSDLNRGDQLGYNPAEGVY